MAISINTVYQKVLALANKEQRGYINPQDFNLFADMAQMEIFEQYFYDLDQFSRTPSNAQKYLDKVEYLKEKIKLFETYTPNGRVEVLNNAGWIWLNDHSPKRFGTYNIDAKRAGSDLHRLTRVRVNYANAKYAADATLVDRVENTLYDNSILGASNDNSKRTPQYMLFESGLNSGRKTPTSSSYAPERSRILQIRPAPARAVFDDEGNNVAADSIQIFYIRKPLKPNWAYSVVNDIPLYNSTNSQDFEIHGSDESELVYRILAFAGINLQKPGITQVAASLEAAKVQQEKS